MRHSKRLAMGALGGLAMLALSASLAMAQMRYLPNAPGTWKPWRFVAYPDDLRQLAARPADVKELDAQLQRLSAILQKTDGFTSPVGFSVETVGALAMDPVLLLSGTGKFGLTVRPLPASLNFGAYPVMEFGSGATARRDDRGETAQVLFYVNDLTQPLFSSAESRVPEFEGLDLDVARLAASQPDVMGLQRYGESLVLKKSAEPVWAAVTYAETLELAARSIERRLAGDRDALARIQSTYDDLKDPKKREQRMAEYRKIAPLQKDPAYVEKMAKVEDTKEKQADTLLPPLADARTVVKNGEQELANARATAAGLSAADKAAPACYAIGQESLARFRRSPAPVCEPLVRPNWKLFNPALPRSAPQVLIITRFSHCLNPDQTFVHVGGCPANKRLIASMDKAALLAWLQ